MYWKEVRSEARTRTRNGLASGYRLYTSIFLPIAGFVAVCIVLQEMTITIPITLVVGVAVTISLFLLSLVGEWCIHIFAIPAEKHEAQKRIISARDELLIQKDNDLQKALTSTTGGYSQAQLAKLIRLHTQGDELLNQTISINDINPRGDFGAWLNKHDRWREDILSILNDFDTAIFERPITAGSQTRGRQQAFNNLHGDRRGQILEERDRIMAAVQRSQD